MGWMNNEKNRKSDDRTRLFAPGEEGSGAEWISWNVKNRGEEINVCVNEYQEKAE